MDNKFNLICARLIEDISGLIMKDFAFEMFCRDLNCSMLESNSSVQ